MRLIDADELMTFITEQAETQADKVVASICRGATLSMPTIDAVPVVRCGECKHHSFDEAYGNHWCNLTLSCRKVTEADFCSQGARMDGEEALQCGAK